MRRKRAKPQNPKPKATTESTDSPGPAGPASPPAPAREARYGKKSRKRGATPLSAPSAAEPLLRVPPKRDSSKHVPFIELVKRESRMLSLLAHGHTPGEITVIMQKEFKLSKGACDSLRRRMQLQIVDFERDNLPALKAKARRRLREHIMRASEANAWSAVGNLEKTLAQMEGTLEPDRVEINVDVRVRDALSKVLSEMDPAQLDALTTEGVTIEDPPHALPPAHVDHAAKAGPSLQEVVESLPVE